MPLMCWLDGDQVLAVGVDAWKNTCCAKSLCWCVPCCCVILFPTTAMHLQKVSACCCNPQLVQHKTQAERSFTVLCPVVVLLSAFGASVEPVAGRIDTHNHTTTATATLRVHQLASRYLFPQQLSCPLKTFLHPALENKNDYRNNNNKKNPGAES